MKTYQKIAGLLLAIENCKKSNNSEWEIKHGDAIDQIIDNGPSGSGIDNGTKMDYNRSTPDKLVFTTAFHHMNDAGCYDGWTEHNIIITPSLHNDFNICITGKDRNMIKEYLIQVYDEWLNKDIN